MKANIIKLKSIEDLPLKNLAAKIATACLKVTGCYCCRINNRKTIFVLGAK